MSNLRRKCAESRRRRKCGATFPHHVVVFAAPMEINIFELVRYLHTVSNLPKKLKYLIISKLKMQMARKSLETHSRLLFFGNVVIIHSYLRKIIWAYQYSILNCFLFSCPARLHKPTEERIEGDAYRHRIALLIFFVKYIKSVTVIDVIYVLKIGCQYE